MMVVVPALTESDESEPKVIAALVSRFIAFIAEQVGQGVDARGAVKQDRRAQYKSPDEQLPSCDAEMRQFRFHPQARKVEKQPQSRRSRLIEAVQPDQFWKPGKIADALVLCRIIPRAHEPAGMGTKEAVVNRRMRVIWGVGLAMVIPMIGGPPERPSLRR